MGVLQAGDGTVAALLAISGVTLEEARLYALSAIKSEGKGNGKTPTVTTRIQRILGMARDEANRLGSPTVGNEHIFIACVRQQRGPHVGEVLRPLGLDAARLREHLRGLNEKPFSEGNPLNDLTPASKRAIDAAHAAMRASFCGRISTAHLLLGILEGQENFALSMLREAGVDIDELKREVRASIFNDGEIATPQQKFSPAAKRALERAKKEATSCNQSLIAPHHLLAALLPRPASVSEKIAFGTTTDNPLENVWSNWPVAEIQSRYEARWKPAGPAGPPTPATPTSKPTNADLAAKSKSSLQFAKALRHAKVAAHASFCGQISTTHLLLGVLEDADNLAVETLRVAKIDIERLKSEVRDIIVGDDQPETSESVFSPVARRALDRAKAEATSSGHSFTGPHHLLYALLPRVASPAENALFGSNIVDPLEQVWRHWPVAAIEQQYENHFLLRKSISKAPSNRMKFHLTLMVAGAFWGNWISGQSFDAFLYSFGFTLWLVQYARGKRIYRLRDQIGSFCIGMTVGLFLLAAMTFLTFKRSTF